MSTVLCNDAQTFPAPVSEVVKAAVGTTFVSICGEQPVCKGAVAERDASDCVVGIIGFVGDLSWTMALGVPEQTAPALVVKFAGFEIPFDSPDMGDVVGELANVLAGDVRARLEGKKIKAQMSLPTIARGKDLKLGHGHGATLRLVFASPQGDFWCELATGQPAARMPGT